jgi:hypothetical protein
MEAPQNLFGFAVTDAELKLIIEIAKAVLLTVTAGISVLIFDALAKRREQDTALFNELVKGRIVALHSINNKLVRSIVDFLQLLEEMSVYADTPVDWRDEKRFQFDEAAIGKINRYRQSLRTHEAELISDIAKFRYDMGESGYLSLTNRVRHLSSRVNELWAYHEKCVQYWKLGLAEKAPPGTPNIERKAELLIAENVAAEGRWDLIRLVDRIHDDFEKVVRLKGRTTTFAGSMKGDFKTGYLMVNSFHEGVGHRLGRMLTRPTNEQES